MKVFVAGGAGYIGSVTTEMLCDEGHDVVVFDNLERGYRPAVDAHHFAAEGSFEGDICLVGFRLQDLSDSSEPGE
jgi:UDP-glucose 4-epimerase